MHVDDGLSGATGFFVNPDDFFLFFCAQRALLERGGE
jgi:hypothetical protein